MHVLAAAPQHPPSPKATAAKPTPSSFTAVKRGSKASGETWGYEPTEMEMSAELCR